MSKREKPPLSFTIIFKSFFTCFYVIYFKEGETINLKKPIRSITMRKEIVMCAVFCSIIGISILSGCTQPTSPSGNNVYIQNYAFNPSTLTIKVGDTVTWTNKDSVDHTVTSDTGVFASSSLANGQTFSYQFTTAGTYAYSCSIHPTMHGTIIVQ